MVLKVLLNTWMIWMIFIKRLKHRIKTRNAKYWCFLMIWLLICNNPIVTESFIRGRKLNISFVFSRQSYFSVPKNIRLISTHSFNMKIPNKQELQQITFDHSSDIDFKDLI